jgi:ketosteroid isomerase-like protein
VLDLARRGFEALNSGNLEALFALVADDVVAVVPSPFANDGVYRGSDGFRLMTDQWLEAWGEFHAEPLDFIEVGDAVVVPVRQTGTGRGSGVEVAADLVYLFRSRDGLMVEWHLFREVGEALAYARGEQPDPGLDGEPSP